MQSAFIKFSCIKCKCEYALLEEDIELFSCEVCNENKLDLERVRKLLERFNSNNITEKKNGTNWSRALYLEDTYQNIDELMFELKETIFKDRFRVSCLEPDDFTQTFTNTGIKKVTTNVEKVLNLDLQKFKTLVFVFYIDQHASIFEISEVIEQIQDKSNDNEIYFDVMEIKDSEIQRVEIFHEYNCR